MEAEEPLPPGVGGKIPDGWLECPNSGEIMHGIVAIKTPLSKEYTQDLPSEQQWYVHADPRR